MNGKMGAMQFVNTAGSQPANVNGNSAKGIINQGGERASGKSFFSALQQSISQMTENSTSVEVPKELSIIEDTGLLVDMEKLLELLTTGEESLNTIVLDEVSNEQLLEMIPIHLQEELLALFEQQLSLDELMTEESLQDPVHLLAIVMTLAYMEQQQSSDSFQQGSQRLLAQIQDHLQQMFPIQMNNHDKNNWKLVVEKLTEQLKQAPKESTAHTSNNLSSWLSSLTEKPNVQEVVQSVYNRVFPSTNGDKAFSTAISNLDGANGHMARLQQFLVHSGEQQVSRPSEQQFLRQFQNILARSQFQQLGNGLQQLTVRLHPESLGRLDITLQQINGVMVAKLMTTTAVAKDLLESQLHHLRHAFQGQQIQVERIEVTQQQQPNQLLRDKEQEAFEENQQNQGQKNQDDLPEEESFSAYLEETINMEA